MRGGLPLEIEGEILDEKALIEQINVADEETLLYEVKYNDELKRNDYYAFIPKPIDKKKVR